jgi:Tfp pilus assembly protein PilX
MVVKPTTDDGWTIVIAAAVLVVLTVLFLAPLRSRSGPSTSSTATD